MVKVDYKFIDEVLERFGFDKGNIIGIMQAVQEEYRYLPQEVLEYIADKIDVSTAKIFGVTGLSENQPTTSDGLFTIETVSCLGACGLSPVVMVNETVHGAMNPDKAKALINELREKEA